MTFRESCLPYGAAAIGCGCVTLGTTDAKELLKASITVAGTFVAIGPDGVYLRIEIAYQYWLKSLTDVRSHWLRLRQWEALPKQLIKARQRARVLLALRRRSQRGPRVGFGRYLKKMLIRDRYRLSRFQRHFSGRRVAIPAVDLRNTFVNFILLLPHLADWLNSKTIFAASRIQQEQF